MYKVDLHTHSTLSFDGGITKKQYVKLLDDGVLDFVAITDHNETRFARILREELGDKIIIGEEIRTLDGEIIGLFLEKTIPPGLSAKETIHEIKAQKGLVYIPHPFEKGRLSLQEEVLQAIVNDIDIIETFNARGLLRGKGEIAKQYAIDGKLGMSASSDAHCVQGIGTAFSQIKGKPSPGNLRYLLKKGMFQERHAPFYTYLCPGYNKVKNKIILRGSL